MKPSSQVKIRACRLNGALSRGPVTEEGKRRSAGNSLYHGMYSKQAVLPGESRKVFDALIQKYVRTFKPRNTQEIAEVHEMAVARWKMHRLTRLERQLIDENTPHQPPAWMEEIPETCSETPDIDTLIIGTQVTQLQQHLAYYELFGNSRFNGLHRHENRLHCAYHRALNRLLALQHGKK